MKYILLMLLSITCFYFPAYPQTAFTGKVMDRASGEGLPGASVSIPDLARQTVTNERGLFFFENLPEGRFTVQVSFLGYKTHAERVLFSGFTEKSFSLEVSLLEMREIVVTASASASKEEVNSISVESVSRKELLNTPASNLIDALSGVAGVSQISSGPAVSKPVIRGLSYHRVLTVNNGIKQEGQQWGDEHGLEYDLFAADRVEILRGPASLLYGSDAMGGVINILDPIPVPDGEIQGSLTSRYAANNGLTETSLQLEGNRRGFVWRGRGTYRNAFSYKTPAGYVPNTSFNEANFTAMAGLNKKWGYSHLHVSSYSGKLGFPEHGHADHGHDDFPAQEDPHHGHQPRSRQIGLPLQQVDHLKVSLNNNFILGRSQLRATFGVQQNKRREMEHSPSEPDIAMDLQTWSGDLKFFMAEKGGFEPVLGLSGSWQENRSGGTELLVPAFDASQAGAFFYLKKALDAVYLNAGIRFDYRRVRGKAMASPEGETRFEAFERDFSNFSGSAGLAWDLGSGFLFKANAGSAFRAPTSSELASNGEHHGVERYEIGSTSLKSEQSLQLDAAIAYTSRNFGIELNAYRNTIYHYIYLRGLVGDSILHEGELLPVYRYTQADARLSGMEAVVDLHPISWLHIGSSFSVVRGKNKETDGNLPFIPAASWRNELKFEPELGLSRLNETYFTLELASTFKQDRVDAAFERPAAGYHLVNAGVGTTLSLGRLPLSVFVSARNLFNVKYTSHMSRYRYLGISEPGRNLQFGLHLPFNLK